jgi:hypothetical protein
VGLIAIIVFLVLRERRRKASEWVYRHAVESDVGPSFEGPPAELEAPEKQALPRRQELPGSSKFASRDSVAKQH